MTDQHIRRISLLALNMLKRHEGRVLHAYDDLVPGGKPFMPGDELKGTLTIGYGHTKSVQPGQCITEEEADRLLREDLRRFERGVEALAAECGVTLTQYQFDALVSFSFNVGLKALEVSTLWARLCAGYPDTAADEFLRWKYSKGDVLPGLVKRREDERRLFLGLRPRG
jgi:lysozyme